MADPALASASGTGVGASRSDGITRIFGSRVYFQLWCSQVVSFLGTGSASSQSPRSLLASAAGIPEGRRAGAAARVVPGLFRGSFMGVAADRFRPQLSEGVLHAGPPGFGVLLTVFGLGVATGILAVSLVQKWLPHTGTFQAAVLVGGGALMLASSMWRLPLAGMTISAFGLCTEAAYVLGFSLPGSDVSDDLRGRIFATLYTSTRLRLFLALVVARLVASALDGLSGELLGHRVRLAGVTVHLPGVRLTMWLGGLVIIGAGALTRTAMHSADHSQPIARPAE